jgi:diacylglycerol kinase (ATP)
MVGLQAKIKGTNMTVMTKTEQGKKIKNIHIIINPAAGKNEPVLAQMNEALKDSGLKWEILITKKSGDGLYFAKEAVKAGVDAVAAYGGDGTQMEVATGLMGTDIPLAILPGGSANVLAKELNISTNLKEAFELIHGPHQIREVDMARYGSCYFITGFVLGFGAEIIKGADRKTKNKFGILAYFISAAAALKKLKLTTYRLKIDGEDYEEKGLTCLVYNVGNLGFTKVPLDQNIDVSDGLLDVIILRKANLSLLKLIATTLLTRERPENYELVRHWQAKDICIHPSRKQVIQCDGELITPSSIHILALPSAIKIIVPKHETKE